MSHACLIIVSDYNS